MPHARAGKLLAHNSPPSFMHAAARAGKLLAYNCSPSFNWKKLLSDSDIASFQARLGQLGEQKGGGAACGDAPAPVACAAHAACAPVCCGASSIAL